MNFENQYDLMVNKIKSCANYDSVRETLEELDKAEKKPQENIKFVVSNDGTGEMSNA